MLLKHEVLQEIAEGRVDLVFRRWRRPTVRTGGRLRTAIGELAIDEVAVIGEDDVTDDDAWRAGHESLAALLAELGRRRDGDLYRIRLHLRGPDPRHALRHSSDLSPGERATITTRLSRLDRASRRGPWTAATLEVIARRPATGAAELATQLGHETAWFKSNVRKLKELGLTESLEVGYRLSARGRSYLTSSDG